MAAMQEQVGTTRPRCLRTASNFRIEILSAMRAELLSPQVHSQPAHGQLCLRQCLCLCASAEHALLQEVLSKLTPVVQLGVQFGPIPKIATGRGVFYEACLSWRHDLEQTQGDFGRYPSGVGRNEPWLSDRDKRNAACVAQNLSHAFFVARTPTGNDKLQNRSYVSIPLHNTHRIHRYCPKTFDLHTT